MTHQNIYAVSEITFVFSEPSSVNMCVQMHRNICVGLFECADVPICMRIVYLCVSMRNTDKICIHMCVNIYLYACVSVCVLYEYLNLKLSLCILNMCSYMYVYENLNLQLCVCVF